MQGGIRASGYDETIRCTSSAKRCEKTSDHYVLFWDVYLEELFQYSDPTTQSLYAVVLLSLELHALLK